MVATQQQAQPQTPQSDQTTLTSRPLWGNPVNMDQFEQERTERKKNREKNRTILQQCLNHEIAELIGILIAAGI